MSLRELREALERWRDAERQMATLERGSLEHAAAVAEFDFWRHEYHRRYDELHGRRPPDAQADRLV